MLVEIVSGKVDVIGKACKKFFRSESGCPRLDLNSRSGLQEKGSLGEAASLYGPEVGLIMSAIVED